MTTSRVTNGSRCIGSDVKRVRNVARYQAVMAACVNDLGPAETNAHRTGIDGRESGGHAP